MPFIPLAGYAGLALLGLAFFIIRSIGLPWIGKVSHIGDGDSIEARAWFNTYRIRIRGIDAPEYRQEYGLEARQALVDILGERRALFIPFGSDRYGRLLCWIITSKGLVSWRMVWGGHAWPGSIATYILHIPPRILRRGLWKADRHLHPNLWRRYGQNMSIRTGRKSPKKYIGR